MRHAVLAFALLAASARAAEPALTFDATGPQERVPVLNMQLDGGVTFSTVKLPVPPEGYATHVCIREFDASQIRCYVIDFDNMRWLHADLDIAK